MVRYGHWQEGLDRGPEEYLEHENIIDQGLDALVEVLSPLCEGWQVAGLCCDCKGLQLPQQLTLRTAILTLSLNYILQQTETTGE